MWAIWCTRSAASVFGFAERWLKMNDQVMTWKHESDAQGICDEMNLRKSTPNVKYEVKQYGEMNPATTFIT